MTEKGLGAQTDQKQKNNQQQNQQSQRRGVVLKGSLEGNSEYFIEEEDLGCCGVENTLYTIRRSGDPSWVASERNKIVHFIEDNKALCSVKLNNLTFSYEELGALRELINYFCVKSHMFNDLYITQTIEDFYSPYTWYSTNTFDNLVGDEFIGAPGFEDIRI